MKTFVQHFQTIFGFLVRQCIILSDTLFPWPNDDQALNFASEQGDLSLVEYLISEKQFPIDIQVHNFNCCCFHA